MMDVVCMVLVFNVIPALIAALIVGENRQSVANCIRYHRAHGRKVRKMSSTWRSGWRYLCSAWHCEYEVSCND